MNGISEYTKTAAYHMWLITEFENTITLWHCAEDIAYLFRKNAIWQKEQLAVIMKLGSGDLGYVEFVRHIAFRLHIHTGVTDCFKNWMDAERLLNNMAWVDAVLGMASGLEGMPNDGSVYMPWINRPTGRTP